MFLSYSTQFFIVQYTLCISQAFSMNFSCQVCTNQRLNEKDFVAENYRLQGKFSIFIKLL